MYHGKSLVVSAALSAARERRTLRLSGLPAKEGYAETFKRIMANINDTHGTTASYHDKSRYNSLTANTLPNGNDVSSTGPVQMDIPSSISPQQLMASNTSAPVVDTSAEDVLRKLGIHMDSLGATGQPGYPMPNTGSGAFHQDFTGDVQTQSMPGFSFEASNALAGVAPWPYAAVYEDFVGQPTSAYPQDFFSYGISV